MDWIECIASSIGAIATACVCILSFKQMLKSDKAERSAQFVAKKLGGSKIEITNIGHCIARNVTVTLGNHKFQKEQDDLTYEYERSQQAPITARDLGSIQAYGGKAEISLEKTECPMTLEYTIKWDDDYKEKREENKTINIR